MKINIKLLKEGKIPQSQTAGSAGYDVYSTCNEVIKPGEFKLIRLGFCMEIPIGFEAQIRPRSGMALKYGVTVLNTPGTIDSDYRNEVGVLLVNFGKEEFNVKKHERIAQMIFAQYSKVNFELIEDMDQTDRTNGWGSTGTNDLVI